MRPRSTRAIADPARLQGLTCGHAQLLTVLHPFMPRLAAFGDAKIRVRWGAHS